LIRIRASPRYDLVPDADRKLITTGGGENDGYRALLIKDDARIKMRSRNDKDLTRMYPGVVRAMRKLSADAVVLDGEIVALDAAGKPSFQALQHRGENPEHQIVFYAFDVLRLGGRDVTREPLIKRRARLPAIIGQHATLRVSQVLPGTAADVVAAVRAAGLEGVIAKRKDSIYQPGERSGDWLKLKLEHQQEFVIGGYRPDGSKGVDALLVGYYEGRDLRFAGKVRAGMVPHDRRELLKKLKPLEVNDCPFVNLPDATSSRWQTHPSPSYFNDTCVPSVAIASPEQPAPPIPATSLVGVRADGSLASDRASDRLLGRLLP
jgi:DNA ligase D-like protein (predicted ligase)